MVSIPLPISNASNRLTKLLGTDLRTPITLGMIFSIMFHNILFSNKVKWLFIILFSLIFTVVRRDNNNHYMESNLGLVSCWRWVIFFIIIIIFFYSLGVFHWILSESKSPQVYRTLILSILVVLNNVVVWMVSTRPLSSKSSKSL